MNDQIENSSIQKRNYKIIGFSLILLIGLAILSILYIDFEHSYKRIELTETKNITPPALLEPSMSNTTPLVPTLQTNIKPIAVEQSSDNLSKLFYQMRIAADQGKDFSQEAQKLDKFKTTISPEFDILLTELEALSARNIEDEYFRHSFANMLHDLYRLRHQKTNIIHSSIDNFFDNLLFIRPTGERAIKHGGFDMDVALTEQALAQNNLELAQSYMKKITNESEEFKILLLKLDSRIKIKNDLEKLNKILEQE